MSVKIAVLPGDGVGPEVTRQALKVLEAVGERLSLSFDLEEYPAGGAAIEQTGEPLPEPTIQGCRAGDCVLFGAVGHPRWDHLPAGSRPEQAVLGLRKELGLFANLRPASLSPQLVEASPLKASLIPRGFDLLIVRELTGGIYFGEKGRETGETDEWAYDVERYAKSEVERIARVAFQAALGRRKKVTSVDKANVLESSRLFRRVVEAVALDYPDVELDHLYVDNAAMQLIRNPAQFDVMLTNNIFGDILSDEASVLTGSIGLLPSASMGAGRFGLYEPIHGTAPDIAGRDLVNPLGAVLSAAMLLRHTVGNEPAAAAVEAAVAAVLAAGFRTADMAGEQTTPVGTEKMGDLVVEELKRQA